MRNRSRSRRLRRLARDFSFWLVGVTGFPGSVSSPKLAVLPGQRGNVVKRARLISRAACTLGRDASHSFDDTVRSIKMDTETSEVCLLETAALVEIVDAKLRNPRQCSLGSDGIQRFFSNSGVITVEDVQNLTG